MKVLFFIESLRAGGKERRIVELLKGLKRKADVEILLVLTRKEIHYHEVFELGITIEYAERKFFKKDPLVFFKFFRVARRFHPDVIHVWGHMVAFYAVPAKWILRVPLINNEITDSTPNQKLLAKNLVFRASDRIIANTEAGLIAYQAPLEKSGVIYNGFNFERINSLENNEQVRAKFDIRTGFVVAMVASFLEYKDWSTYVKAAKQVLTRRNDVTFLCIGDGDDSQYRKMVTNTEQGRILFLGKQSKVESIMNICDIGVLTTNVNNHGEGISNALMEFMALGKPVIATNFGGSVELIESNKSGYLIDAFSVDQLTEKIIQLIEQDSLRSQIGANALKRVQDKFSIDGMVNSFYQEYLNFVHQ